MKLNREQQLTLNAMLAGNNVWSTGYAGSGKTTVLNFFRDECTKRGRNIATLAPTGRTALESGGSTIHRFLSLPPMDVYPCDCIPETDPETARRIMATEIVVLEEVSMISSSLFSMIERIFRKFHLPFGGGQPFGGRQIVALGDVLQLPPVIRKHEHYETIKREHGGIFAFQTPAWRALNFSIAFLKTIHRQNDDQFATILNAIRCGDLSTKFGDDAMNCLETLNQQVKILPWPPEGSSVLCLTNAEADVINIERENKLPGTPKKFVAKAWGDFDAEDYPAPKHLFIKPGSRMMMAANQTAPNGSFLYTNGQTGHVREITPEVAWVQLDNGSVVEICPRVWVSYEYSVSENPATGDKKLIQHVTGGYCQFPMKLAHAVTIHKAQGCTLTGKGHISLPGETFCHSQIYVGCSRLRALDLLSLSRPLAPEDIKVDEAALAFDRMCQEKSFLP